MDIQDLIAWTMVLAGMLFLYFNIIAILAESLGRRIVHSLNMRIKKQKREEARVEALCEQDYRRWLHTDPCWIGE